MPGHQLYGGDRFLVLHDVFRQRQMWSVAVFAQGTVGLMDLSLTQCNGACLYRQKRSRVPARGGLTSIFRKEREQTVGNCSDASVSREHTAFTKQQREDFHCKLTRERRDNKWYAFFATAVGKKKRTLQLGAYHLRTVSNKIWARCNCQLGKSTGSRKCHPKWGY